MFRLANPTVSPNDRYIPRRIPVNIDLHLENGPENENTIFLKDTEFINAAKTRYNRNNYQKALKEALLPMDTKVLNFFPPKKTLARESKSVEIWPVTPRNKPVIGPPRIILDMPHFDGNICHHVADWSSNNFLATIFQKEVHLWAPGKQSYRGVTDSSHRVKNCVKWNPKGTFLALGLYPNKYGIWEVESDKLIAERCCCFYFCEIYSLEWIHDDCLLTGCSKGVLTMSRSDLNVIKTYQVGQNQSSVINITSNVNKRLIAVSTLDKKVIVLSVSELSPLFQIEFPATVNALAWHPWRSSILATGLGRDEGRVVIWNVITAKQIACEKTAYQHSSVDCLTFNPKTGELVVSYFVLTPNPSQRKGVGIISVLSSIDEIVEELHIHTGPIPYLLWGNGGKVLASISADENLCIWDFFDTKPKRNFSEKKGEKVEEKLFNGSVFNRYKIR